jgi:hypothetical protein
MPAIKSKKRNKANAGLHFEKFIGLLVLLGFGVAAFAPAAYRRSSLLRPSMEASSWGGFRA